MRKLTLLLLLLFLVSPAVWSQSADSIKKPKIGLALGGGGAKGLAHIGVLKVLEEYGIYPQYISGTSMGSIVGGLYAIGYTPRELADFAKGLQWNNYFTDSYPRAFLPVEERDRADRYQLTFAIKEGSLQLPRGLIQGRKIQTLLAGLTVPVHDVGAFDDYYLPFRAVATNLETGEGVVFEEGALGSAIRASMSIPSVFEPLEYNDKLLVDGLLVRNLPVSDAFDMGADFVIAVDVGTPLYGRDELGSIIKVLEQTSSFFSAISTEEQRALASYLILPDLGTYTTLSYDRADSLVWRGEVATRAAMPGLLKVLDSLQLYPPLAGKERTASRRDSFNVTEIAYLGDDAAQQVMRQLFPARLPAIFSKASLADHIARLYGSGFLATVNYQLLPLKSGTAEVPDYRLELTGKNAVTAMVRASINYDNDFSAGLLLNATLRNRLGRGSLLSTDVRISENPALMIDYQLYTRTRPSIGVSFNNRLDFFQGRVYDNYRTVNEFQFHQLHSQLSVFSGLGPKIFLEAGLFGERLSQNRRFYTFEDGEAVLNQFSSFFHISRETYDRASFPRRGSRSSVRIDYTLGGTLRERTNEGREFNLAKNLLFSADVYKVFPVRQHFWFDLFAAGGLINYRERNLINLLYLGRAVPNQYRFFEFYGIRYMEQPVTSFGYLGLKLRQEIGRNNFIVLGANYAYYLLSDFSLITDGGSLTRQRTEGDLWGIGLELGSITPLGPVRITMEYNPDRGRVNFSLHGGYYF